MEKAFRKGTIGPTTYEHLRWDKREALIRTLHLPRDASFPEVRSAFSTTKGTYETYQRHLEVRSSRNWHEISFESS